MEDSEWFFDTELLVIAERAGLRIHEVPVDWVDDPDSRVDLVSTAMADLRGIARIGRALARGTLPTAGLRRATEGDPPGPLAAQLLRFGAVGVVSTVGYVLLYGPAPGGGAPGRQRVGAADLRRREHRREPTAHLRAARAGRSAAAAGQKGLVVFGLGLALTSGSLAALHRWAPGPARPTEVAVLVIANLVATLLRFLLLRAWVFTAALRGNGTGAEPR